MSAQQALRNGRRKLGWLLVILGLVLVLQASFTTAKAELSQVLLQQAWAKTSTTTPIVKPWPWADTWPVAKITAPRLGKSNIVLAEAGGEALAFGPSLLNASGSPRTGEQVLIAAHRNTHFTWLKDLKTGDTLLLQNKDLIQAEYQVVGMQIVKFDDSGIEVDPTDNRLALITCYPFDAKLNGPLRYIVWAEPIMSEVPNKVI
ncbi:MAG: class GN sortase [Robiginitomaculum sp.]|nr:class GN sortase [Robiginitomaculum sp.]